MNIVCAAVLWSLWTFRYDMIFNDTHLAWLESDRVLAPENHSQVVSTVQRNNADRDKQLLQQSVWLSQATNPATVENKAFELLTSPSFSPLTSDLHIQQAEAISGGCSYPSIADSLTRNGRAEEAWGKEHWSSPCIDNSVEALWSFCLDTAWGRRVIPFTILR